MLLYPTAEDGELRFTTAFTPDSENPYTSDLAILTLLQLCSQSTQIPELLLSHRKGTTNENKQTRIFAADCMVECCLDCSDLCSRRCEEYLMLTHEIDPFGSLGH
jgi:hypothetical protein